MSLATVICGHFIALAVKYHQVPLLVTKYYKVKVVTVDTSK